MPNAQGKINWMGLADLGFNLMELKQRQGMDQAKLDAMREANKLEAHKFAALYGGTVDGGGTYTPGEPGKLGGVEGAKIGLQQDELKFKQQQSAWANAPVDRVSWDLTRARMEKVAGKDATAAFFEPVNEFLDQASQASGGQMPTRKDLYAYLSQNFGMISQDVQDSMGKAYESAIQKEDQRTARKLAAMKQELTNPAILDKFFPGAREELEPIMAKEAYSSKGETAQSSIGKLLADRNDLAAQDPENPSLTIYDAAIQKAVTPTGMTIRTNPDGTMELIQGPLKGQDASGLGKEAINQIEEEGINVSAGLQRLSMIEKSFRPEFMELGTRLGTSISKWKEKLGGKLQGQDKADLENFSAFKRDALDNLNRYIKEITGAQMSIQEAERIQRGMPNPGAGIFDGDSPTEFKSKMEATVKALRLSGARLAFTRQHGLSIKAVSLDAMPGIMDDRGDQIWSEIEKANPGMAEAQIQAAVRKRVAQEFGLTE